MDSEQGLSQPEARVDGPLFVLVHGTWARKAPWTLAGSSLVERLEREFLGCTVRTIDWSGANTFDARTEAASKIVAQIEGGARSDTILIGHSHGGSAIVYALQQSTALRAQISGAILLGTPFFAIAPRMGYRELFRAIALLVLATGTALLSFLTGYTTNPQLGSQDTQDVMLLSIGGLAFTSVLLLGRRLTAHTNWLDTLWTRLSQAASNLNTVNCPTAPLLFLRTTGDEIALALAGLQLMAYVSNVTSSLFARIMGSVMRAASTAWAKPWSRLVLVCLGASLIVALFMCGTLMGRYEFPLVTVAEVLNPFGRGWMLTVTGSEVVDAWLTFTFEGLLTAAAVIMASVGFLGIALVCALVSVTVLSTFTLWAFGSFSPVAALALEMAAEPVPRGTHEFVHLSWENGSSARQKDGFSLRHSAPYEDPEALDAVVAWSRRRLDNAQLHTPVQA